MVGPRSLHLLRVEPVIGSRDSSISPTAYRMSRALDWQGANARERVLQRSSRPGRGITNKQAKILAALQRKAGEPYTGNGMSARQAGREIGRLSR
jgi:hypothetical protein